MVQVDIYITQLCPFCTRALRLLKTKDINLNIFDLTSDIEMRTKLFEKTGFTTVPQIFVDGNYLGNCDHIHDLEMNGKLNLKLGIESKI